jgi:hypothetical protein
MLARLPIQAWTKPRVAETSQQRQNGRESTQESSDPPRLNLALKISSIEEAVGRLSGARLTLSPHRATAALDPKPTSDALRRSRPRRTALSRPARALDFVRTVIRGDRRPETSSLLVDLSAMLVSSGVPGVRHAACPFWFLARGSKWVFPYGAGLRSGSGRSPLLIVCVDIPSKHHDR